MRLAFFGGSFDPIHRGHLALASAAVKAFNLTTILFAPTGRQPLKSNGPAASFQDRLAMVELACAGSADGFQASGIDAPNVDGSPNYTVDVLIALRDTHPGANLYSLVGLDSFCDLHRWRRPDLLITLAEWIVVSRPGYTLDLSRYTEEQQRRIHPLDTVHEEVSATMLRDRLRRGVPCDSLLLGPVVAYIADHHLYRDRDAEHTRG